MPAKLALRDAVVMNGVLIHGLDYDDTHLEGVVHASSSCFSCALGMAAEVNASGRDLITAYIAGLEAIARIGMVAKGGLHLNGLHPTGTIAAFASALIAGKLMGLDAEQLVMAQGNALSTSASSSRQYSQEGAWTKRLHPGWGAAAGITAAAMARGGFVGPRQVYEGDYSLYRTLTGTRFEDCDLSLATQGLGHGVGVGAGGDQADPGVSSGACVFGCGRGIGQCAWDQKFRGEIDPRADPRASRAHRV